ncbi:hypothetical protein FCULG_00011243 [Fusarium culmorum]|uniref:Integral membrane protein n=1 Tax=Fusarium culmorum TaxID=5516 RepID=A0A2T4H530_FUSCU|nr:hypothetical protein FCULG_00011243 [Fusarium culmorum]
MGQYGYLIPDRYVREVPNEVDMNTASIFWGFSLCAAVFTFAKGTQQSWRAWKRRHRVTAYVGMIWVVWLSSMVLGCLAWGFQRQYIAPSFGFYFSVALFWALQVQFLLQIIINRIGLLMVSKARATRLKWIVFVIILLVNISVFVIWMPARLQINDRWIRLNSIWDRCEKVIFAVVDGVLNGYFIYLVRSRLIENGLTKYIPLYRMNLGLIVLSLSLDIVLVGLMSLPSSLVYLSFHPVAYLLKLQIEMKMAELITKIVRSSGTRGSDEGYYHSSNITNVNHRPMTSTAKAKRDGPLTGMHGAMRGRNTTLIEGGDLGELESSLESARNGRDNMSGIVRTIETTVNSLPAHVVEPSSPTEARHSEYAQKRDHQTVSLEFLRHLQRQVTDFDASPLQKKPTVSQTDNLFHHHQINQNGRRKSTASDNFTTTTTVVPFGAAEVAAAPVVRAVTILNNNQPSQASPRPESKAEATERMAVILAPTGRREYLFRVILISNQRFIQLKIHHRKMEEQKQLFYNAREKVVEWEKKEKEAEKAEKEEDDKRDR